MHNREFFPVRGVIEGYYGTPWTNAERLDMIRFLGRHGFNTYYYSPKDDPYLRERWQEPHPPEALEQMEGWMACARESGVRFVYCLSPGLNMEYADDSHVSRLLAKYRSMYERGVRHFALLFDDIPLALMHPADVSRYRTLAQAHAEVVLKLHEVIDGWEERVELTVCPTQYHGMGDEPYITELGQRLPESIDLFWTGRFVCSPFLPEADARFFAERTGHKPLIWDNYPVNDLAMADELHIGPLRHRDPGLWRHVAGYVANPMARAESSKIPLLTAAAYLRDPEGYDPALAWAKAVEEVAGPEDAAAVLRFADNVQGSFLNETESPALLEAFLQFRFQFLYGDRQAGLRMLGRLFADMEETALHLMERMRNRKLAAEIGGWVEKYRHWAKVGQSVTAMIEAGTSGRTLTAAYHLFRLKRWMKRTERLPQKVCGNVMKLFVEAVLLELKLTR
jgi:hyaluronoglucosaminidase